ncbi:MAG: nitronate monooxygenase [Coriobacteriaceae bacterium]|nr:nitronate monooxygenase [Coriobacteriaceae bacterium]
MQTRITELLGIEEPIFQGGMAWVADASLAAAVSNAGGLGILGGGSADAETISRMIDEVQALTDKPFGVNIMLMSPEVDAIAQAVIDKGVKVVTTGAGSPSDYMEAWKAAGVKVIPVVASTALARRMERSGADAIVAEGTESGGHIGEMTTMALVPQVVSAVSIPVVAAGGIASPRQYAAALMLGAEGIQMGTRFLTVEECTVHPAYKEKVLGAKDSDTIVTGRAKGTPVRSLKNKLMRAARAAEYQPADETTEESEIKLSGSLRRAVVEGDMDTGTIMAGQVAGMVTERGTAASVIEAFSAGVEDLLGLDAASLLQANQKREHLV